MKISTLNKENSINIKKSIDNGICNRCLSKTLIPNKCLECNNSSELLYYSKRVITFAPKPKKLEMSFELSSSQIEASQFFLNHYKEGKSAFLNAVCGSGKTEIMYETILYALNKRDSIVISIPRKEIVLELYERLKGVFINTTIKMLDGEHHDDDAELLISTVHQLINYEDEFDLIILDEADAYPYAGNPFLERLVNKSLKKTGVLLKMSATKKEIVSTDEFSINRRYHNHDLTMPIYFKDYSKDITNNIDFLNIINNKNRKYIIYTSTINKAYDLSIKLKCEYVSSKNKNINKIIDDFRNGKSNLLVSTTILERGVTFKNLDVIIADASNDVFNHQTIIQICGRVGRSIDDPIGNIYIFYKTNSIKFRLVDSYIRRANKNAL